MGKRYTKLVRPAMQEQDDRRNKVAEFADEVAPPAGTAPALSA